MALLWRLFKTEVLWSQRVADIFQNRGRNDWSRNGIYTEKKRMSWVHDIQSEKGRSAGQKDEGACCKKHGKYTEKARSEVSSSWRHAPLHFTLKSKTRETIPAQSKKNRDTAGKQHSLTGLLGRRPGARGLGLRSPVYSSLSGYWVLPKHSLLTQHRCMWLWSQGLRSDDVGDLKPDVNSVVQGK